jgi:NitT/TauT family transport system ATP-binding protein
MRSQFRLEERFVVQDVVNFDKAGFAPGGAPLLADISLALPAGRWLSLLGPEGSGKTTLLRLAAGLVAPTSGAVRTTPSVAALFADDDLPDNTPARDILSAAGATPEQAERLFQLFGLEDYRQHTPFMLSRGFRKRLAIAQRLVGAPKLLLLDDPFGPLDRKAKALTIAALRTYVGTGVAILATNASVEDAAACADEIVLLSPAPAATIRERFVIDLPYPRTRAAIEALECYDILEDGLWEEA